MVLDNTNTIVPCLIYKKIMGQTNQMKDKTKTYIFLLPWDNFLSQIQNTHKTKIPNFISFNVRPPLMRLLPSRHQCCNHHDHCCHYHYYHHHYCCRWHHYHCKHHRCHYSHHCGCGRIAVSLKTFILRENASDVAAIAVMM